MPQNIRQKLIFLFHPLSRCATLNFTSFRRFELLALNQLQNWNPENGDERGGGKCLKVATVLKALILPVPAWGWNGTDGSVRNSGKVPYSDTLHFARYLANFVVIISVGMVFSRTGLKSGTGSSSGPVWMCPIVSYRTASPVFVTYGTTGFQTWSHTGKSRFFSRTGHPLPTPTANAISSIFQSTLQPASRHIYHNHSLTMLLPFKL